MFQVHHHAGAPESMALPECIPWSTIKWPLNPALLLLGEAPEYLAQMLPKFLIQRFATAFGNENHVVFVLPVAVA
jgi:hypothetical protein